MPKLPSLLLGSTLLLMVFNAAAEGDIYRWVDDQGVTQYTQYPPIGRSSEKISQRHSKASSSAQEKLQQQNDGLSQRRELKNLTGTLTTAEQKDHQQRQAFCAKAQQNITMLKNRLHVSEKKADGSVVALSAEQKAAKIQKIQAQIKEHCP